MERVVSKNNISEGFTLLESIFAVFLLTIVMLWTMQCMVGAYNITLRNQLRDEAVNIGEEQLTIVRNTPFSTLFNNPTTTDLCVTRQIRNFNYRFEVKNTISKVLDIAVAAECVITWKVAKKKYHHKIATVVSK